MLSTLTSKGQMTLPAKIRRMLGLKPGDRLECIPRENGTVTLIPKTLPVGALKGILPRPKKPVSPEDIERGIAEGAVESGLAGLD